MNIGARAFVGHFDPRSAHGLYANAHKYSGSVAAAFLPALIGPSNGPKTASSSLNWANSEANPGAVARKFCGALTEEQLEMLKPRLRRQEFDQVQHVLIEGAESKQL